MDIDAIQRCERRIAEEEELALAAASPDAEEMHAQAAMMYRTQLALLNRGWISLKCRPDADQSSPDAYVLAAGIQHQHLSMR